MDEEAVAGDLVRQMLAAFNSGDIAALAGYLHPDARAEFPFAPPVMPSVFIGRDEVMMAFTQGRANFIEMTITPHSVYWCEKEQTLVIEATSAATMVGGAKYRNAYVFLVGIKDGAVVLWREYFNGLVAQQAIEVQAAPVPARL